MKKLLLSSTVCLAVILCTMVSFGQQTEKKSTESGFFIRNDLVYYIKGNTVNFLESDQELDNGASINQRGMIKYPDGKTAQLQQGEIFTFNNVLVPNAVEEYLELKDGKLQIVTNGIFTHVQKAMKLETGVTIDEEGHTSSGITLMPKQKMNMMGELMK